MSKLKLSRGLDLYLRNLGGVGDFKHFTERLGLKPKQQFSLPSPFDYENKRAYVYCYLPEPNSPGLADKLVRMLARH